MSPAGHFVEPALPPGRSSHAPEALQARAGSFSAVSSSLFADSVVEPVAQRSSTARGEWPTYGGDLASSHYSPLDQIREDNFGTLRVAWRAITPDATLSVTLPDGSEWTSRCARRLRRAQSSRSQAMARWAAAIHQQLQSNAADGWRGVVSQHSAVDWRRTSTPARAPRDGCTTRRATKPARRA